MSWKRKRRLQGSNKYYSISNKLKREKKISDDFEVMLNNLDLEEVIGLKLELASRAAGGKLFGICIWNSLTDVIRDAIFKYALSATRSKREAATFLGIDIQTFYRLQNYYGSETYFKEEKDAHGEIT
tara:strand:- start:980 stop:1360 length:381 start_codon:yes stop_codon:yes gene_type:complete